MNKQEIYEYLKEKNIDVQITEHPAVYTVAEAEALTLPHSECSAKNLFLRDDKKRNYYLFTLPYSRAVSIKALQTAISSRSLQFASEKDLMAILQLEKGSVTPLGLLHDTAKDVHFYLDAAFRDSYINIHPNENTATLTMRTCDLARLLEERGIKVNYLDPAGEIL
ncbi:MAG: prolyl-tRNA synthetase associated domain-containing protein [Oscillospiraceae bacterium]|nr:prolyl-tRNA synthetase associated domain-containing protein [Oscillospiraceae bacterium]